MTRCGIFILLLLLPLKAFSQYKNIVLDQRSEGNLACEPAIAINPRNALNIVAASLKDNVYYSFDGGKTWAKKKITSSFGVYGHPVVIADSKGTFYYFHLSDPTGEGRRNEKSLDAIVCHVSEDGGKNWDDGTQIGLNLPKDQDKPWADVNSKGEIVVTWTQFDKYGSKDPDCKSRIMLSSSSNGKKWSKAVEISSTPGNCLDDSNTAQGAAPAVSDDKKLFVAWSNAGKIMLDRSFDNGAIWLTNDIEISRQNGGWNFSIPGHDRSNGFPSIKIDRSKTAHKGMLYMTYAEKVKGREDTDVFFIRTSQFGDFWTSPVRIGEDANNRFQYMPAMCIDQVNGNVYIVYYDRGEYEDLRTDVRLAYSMDKGATFKTVRISETPFIPDESSLFGDYVAISAHKGIVTPVWTRMDQGKTSVVVAVIKQEELPR